LLFWYIDAYWRSVQRKTDYRQEKIHEFLNSPQLVQSFEKKSLVGFTVFDPSGRQYIGTPEAEAFYSIRRTLRYPEVMYFYLTLMFSVSPWKCSSSSSCRW
jgi:hypothetical protein